MSGGAVHVAAARLLPREIGSYGSGTDGPVLIVCGGIHGNEPSGAEAAARVMAALERDRPTLRGRVHFVRGNLRALAAGRRFVDHDLNRVWTDERVAVLRVGGTVGEEAEDTEQRELLALLDRAKHTSVDVTVLDLHTTSSDGPPFAIFSDTVENRKLVLALGVPAVLGLEERVDGTLLDFATREGLRSFVVEGGQHDAELSRAIHVAAIWITMLSTGVIDEANVPDPAGLRVTLRNASGGAPPVSEVRYRHHVSDGDRFRMDPGFRGFVAVAAGQVVAQDRHGPVRAKENGRLLMPLYQLQGNDGFFLVRDVSPRWLTVSAWLRLVRFDLALLVLPGVRRDPANDDLIFVDPRIARLFSVEVFHLAGYRVRGTSGRLLVFARRQIGRAGSLSK